MSSDEPKKKFASPLDRAVVDSHDIWERVANGERVEGPRLLSEAAVAAIVENVIATDLLAHGEPAGVRQRAPTEKPRDPASTPGRKKPNLSKILQQGKDCEERAQEIAKIRRLVRAEGRTIHEVRLDHPEFGIWELVQALPKDRRDSFAKPMQWGPAKGFANNLLAEFKDRSPSTINRLRKAWRRHDRDRNAS